ncbi:GNAT family N-acetyltransferase [Cohnella faecalis]|uniref:GNAT family N-acetyltransferase n=1 Tax=Cohnella faecalis TaxID=2315694 RepID=A0A398CGU9_9BACL|nr:GNAT family N-acetyltransferase [Cohnella faecalis]RIE01973.1 GNAT family N-acetyltransferase [Cohnella faecalis]
MSTPTVAKVRFVSPADSDLAYLIGRLDEDLLRRYPAESVHGLDFADPRIDDIAFVVAYLNGTAIGCGAIRPLDEKCTELKRFYVEPECRGTGVAASMLLELESEAGRRGFESIRLETGALQPEAIRFYEKNGYAPIPPFGEYVDCELSLCYEKDVRSS